MQVLAFAGDFEQLKEFRDFLELRLGVPDEQVATNETPSISPNKTLNLYQPRPETCNRWRRLSGPR